MSGVATAIFTGGVLGAVASNSASRRAAAAQRGASDAASMQAQIAQDQWDKYNEIYAPLERSYVKDAQNYDSPENFARAAGDASATVSSQFGKARDRLTRTPGIDPSSGAYQAGIVGLDLAQAATDATQQNAARQKVQDTAYARKTDALSLGKGLPANAQIGLANAASVQSGIANQQANMAGQQASAVGQLFSPNNLMQIGRTTSNWLGNVGTANTYNTTPGSQQTAMLQAQEFGL